ncbi:MAG: hypothetical protein IKA44_03030, partial [Clostridia bacterium]|nr:hypothetical protein [Clostridia bacterium]
VSAIHKRQSPHPSASPPPSPLGKANTGIPFVQIAETLFSFGTFSTRCGRESKFSAEVFVLLILR